MKPTAPLPPSASFISPAAAVPIAGDVVGDDADIVLAGREALHRVAQQHGGDALGHRRLQRRGALHRVEDQGQDHVGLQRHRGLDVVGLLRRVVLRIGGGDDLDPQLGEARLGAGGDGVHPVAAAMPQQRRLVAAGFQRADLGRRSGSGPWPVTARCRPGRAGAPTGPAPACPCRRALPPGRRRRGRRRPAAPPGPGCVSSCSLPVSCPGLDRCGARKGAGDPIGSPQQCAIGTGSSIRLSI